MSPEPPVTAADAPKAATTPIPQMTRTIALVGLMGVGKSTVGRRLANRLGLPFVDGDEAIEGAARMSVSEIFAQLGEAEFRAGEARVMRRLLEGPAIVLATGGGAVLNPETRQMLKSRATTVWLRADLKVVASRVQRRDTRPLLRGKDPLQALTAMAEVRYPVYATADLTVDVGAGAHAQAVEAILEALTAFWKNGAPA
ncbi:MAG: shikimate kinase [Alphaproteobacteria bacterium]|nr:shikimate kinase [Alphaproteobacteria bacterium]MBU2380476.1 shikimate kinase [Alphaproteobacteria bacterium]